MNPYMDINRIEFFITNACTSRCKHCSVGNSLNKNNTCIDADRASSVISELAQQYAIKSVMTFGGEPLLAADTVCKIHKTSTENKIPCRQVITNGYFTKDLQRISEVARDLKKSGVNSLLLSVDAFHAEHLPIETVYAFTRALCDEHIEGLRLQPAWVIDAEHNNVYNQKTRECLEAFTDLNIPISSGNNIFPSGNAAIYLAEYYPLKAFDLNVKCGDVPYTTKLDSVDTISINPNGDVIVCCFVIGNIYTDTITNIIYRYNPDENLLMSSLLKGGVRGLMDVAKDSGLYIDPTQYPSVCSVCHEIVRKMGMGG